MEFDGRFDSFALHRGSDMEIQVEKKRDRNPLHFSGNMKRFGKRVVLPNKGKGHKDRPRNSNRSRRINGE